ncbi:MAG TPA: zf-HC2 domain-containing protein [Pyrinomonadaceae bacterium]|nr:zf-HC2 domain-containing protein [Pyrinomonadaceae bacterium]
MKCEVCQHLLEEYLDGELAVVEQEQINAHLITCADCSECFTTLTAEQELFSRYDRELEVPPFLWTRIAQHTVAADNTRQLGWRRHLASGFARPVIAAAAAILLIAIAVGILNSADPTLLRNGTDLAQAGAKATTSPKQPDQKTATTDPHREQHRTSNRTWAGSVPQRGSVGSVITPQVKRKIRPTSRTAIAQSDVLSSDLDYLDLYERDTAKHIEQTQNLLRSIRNVAVSDGDEEIDVSYDKALSRRLLNENVVLRRDAEMKAKFPTKSLLADVEPFLIDIANLPDHARPEDVRLIKERVQKTEIVAALMSYQGRDLNNR